MEKAEIDRIKQLEMQEFIIKKLGAEQWITVFRSTPYGSKLNQYFYSALIPFEKAHKNLETYDWDVHNDFGKPIISSYSPDKDVVYSRYGNKDGIEPLIIIQSFYGLEKPSINISEEFRLFHNLFWNLQEKKYQALSLDTGDFEDVINLNDNSVDIKLSYIKKFCAFKEMCLAIYFDIIYYSDEKIDSQIFLNENIEEKGEDYHYIVYWDNSIASLMGKSFSKVLGKKYIQPALASTSGIWPFEKEKIYEEFIIDINSKGEEILFTCNPDKLSNYFGKNRGSPNFLTQIFFKKEVLTKYYGNPNKFQINDGYLTCGGLWGLQIDNNHPDYIIVYLGDLGSLSNSEQKYWRSFNVQPDGSISQVAFNRDFKNEFTDPSALDLTFKYRYSIVNKIWKNKTGWEIYIPLHNEDAFHLTALHVPLNNTNKEFDEQVLSLTKIIIDSLNEKEISKQIISTEYDKGIDKLEKYFIKINKLNYDVYISFLRDLQYLRSSGSAHRKGERFIKARKKFDLESKSLQTVFKEILQKAIDFLDFLMC